jgi:drug/metabolite transporter (DMT)-like permease
MREKRAVFLLKGESAFATMNFIRRKESGIPMQSTQTKGLLYVLICGLLWSTAGVLIKLLPWHSLVIAALRSLLAIVVLYADLVLRQKKTHLLINRKTLATGFFLGATMLLFVSANKLTTAANAIVLQSTSTVFLVLHGILVLHRLPSRRDLTVTALVFGGIVLFFLDQLSPGRMLGNLLGLLSAVTFAGVFYSSTDAGSEHASTSGLILGQIFCAAVGLPFLFLYPPEITAVRIGAILFLGIFQLGLSYVLFARGSQLCSPIAMALTAMVEPICSPIWVALFTKEIPGPLALFGGAVVLVSLTVWSIQNASQSKKSHHDVLSLQE